MELVEYFVNLGADANAKDKVRNSYDQDDHHRIKKKKKHHNIEWMHSINVGS